MKKFNLNENEFNLICDAQNGKVNNLEDIFWKQNIISDVLEAIEIGKLDVKWEVNKVEFAIKLTSLSDLEFLKILIAVVMFWDKENYLMLSGKSKTKKKSENPNVIEKHEPIIWIPENGSFEDFLLVSKGIGMKLIIYVQDCAGDNQSIWATSEEDLLECILTFSDIYYFGRVQWIEEAIQCYLFD